MEAKLEEAVYKCDQCGNEEATVHYYTMWHKSQRQIADKFDAEGSLEEVELPATLNPAGTPLEDCIAICKPCDKRFIAGEIDIF